MTHIGFMRARTLVQEVIELAAKPVVSGDRETAMNELLDAIHEACGGRQPVPEFIERVRRAMRGEVPGHDGNPLPAWSAARSLWLAIETAQQGIENGWPEDYWRQPLPDLRTKASTNDDP